MIETHETRLKRLRMRSMRRGTKEMDMILIRFSEARLESMDGPALDAYEALLDENDQDLYAWISGQQPPPERLRPLVAQIAALVGAPQ